MNAMKDKIFVDSNIWIYLFTSDDVLKNELARNFILDNTAKENILVISYQVINEVGAIESGCRFLTSEDLQNGQDMQGIIVVNIFDH